MIAKRRRVWIAWTVIAIFCSVLQSPQRGYAQVTAREVENSIRRGVDYLRRRQREDGSWPEYSNFGCGLSALCALALVTAGVSPDAPEMESALGYLRKRQPEDTYSVALQTLVFCQVGDPDDVPLIRRNVAWLSREQVREPELKYNRNPGAWGYGTREKRLSNGDPSNTQFALLALAAAEESGIRVEKDVFARSLAYWEKLQNKDGGWGYGQDNLSSGSMTCAGIASTVICRGRLSDTSSRVDGNQIHCCGSDDSSDSIEQGLTWLGSYFRITQNPTSSPVGTDSYQYYYLYALERAGRYTGRRLIGNHDWYREGATELLSKQNTLSHYWNSSSVNTNRFTATAFALLFLSKGKRQVTLGRLDYTNEPDDQVHPDGPRQLVRHVQRAWGRDLTWQTFRLNGASVSDLLQAPVLLITGNRALNLQADEKQRLKDYVEQGGFLIFDAAAGDDCGDATPFEQSVNRLCQELFDSPLEPLPPSHPVWYAERQVDPSALGSSFLVYGVQTCCRTGVIYFPKSLSCRWEINDLTRRIEYNERVEAELSAATSLGQNAIAYATGRELEEKLNQRSVLVGETTERAGQRGVITIPRLAIDAGGEQANRAIPNLARYVSRALAAKITTEVPSVPVRADQLQEFPIVWFHGRRSFDLTNEELLELRTYLKRGGTLLIDSICGDEAFAESVRTMVQRLLPNQPLERVPFDHPMFTNEFNGYDLSNIELRVPQRGASGAITIRKQNTAPVLEMSQRDGRVAVIFSPYDLSCALESQSSIQCPGYSTEDAARIGVNMLLYTLLQ